MNEVENNEAIVKLDVKQAQDILNSMRNLLNIEEWDFPDFELQSDITLGEAVKEIKNQMLNRNYRMTSEYLLAVVEKIMTTFKEVALQRFEDGFGMVLYANERLNEIEKIMLKDYEGVLKKMEQQEKEMVDLKKELGEFNAKFKLLNLTKSHALNVTKKQLEVMDKAINYQDNKIMNETLEKAFNSLELLKDNLTDGLQEDFKAIIEKLALHIATIFKKDLVDCQEYFKKSLDEVKQYDEQHADIVEQALKIVIPKEEEKIPQPMQDLEKDIQEDKEKKAIDEFIPPEIEREMREKEKRLARKKAKEDAM